MQKTLEELITPGMPVPYSTDDPFQQLSDQDMKALEILFEPFNMDEVEPDLLRLSDVEAAPEPEWFSLIA